MEISALGPNQEQVDPVFSLLSSAPFFERSLFGVSPPDPPTHSDPVPFFGEIALIENTRRTATVTTLQPCLLMFLQKDTFANFLAAAPEIKESKLLEKFVRKRTANSLKAIPIFSMLRRKQVSNGAEGGPRELGKDASSFFLSAVGWSSYALRRGQTRSTRRPVSICPVPAERSHLQRRPRSRLLLHPHPGDAKVTASTADWKTVSLGTLQVTKCLFCRMFACR